MNHIFFSYARADTYFADQLIHRLEKEGFSIWVDRSSIRGGDQWRRQIVEAIETAEAFIVLLTSNSIRSDNVRKEIDLAESSRLRIIPVSVETIEIPKEMRYQLVGLQIINLRSNFENGVNQILLALTRSAVPAVQKHQPISDGRQPDSIPSRIETEFASETFDVDLGRAVRWSVIGVIASFGIITIASGFFSTTNEIVFFSCIFFIFSLLSCIGILISMKRLSVSLSAQGIKGRNNRGKIAEVAWKDITKVRIHNYAGSACVMVSYGVKWSELLIPLRVHNPQRLKELVTLHAGKNHILTGILEKKL